jgi:hypothetical protein
MNLRLLLLFTLFVYWSNTYSQNATISGYISDKESAERLIGVNIYAPGIGKGTVTNNYGFYSLTLPSSQNVEIIIDYPGFVLQQFNLNLRKDTTLIIQLSQSIELKEVEIIADKQKRIERETQMSAVDVPIAQIKKIPALLGEVDVLKALQLLPGVKSGGEGQSGFYVRGGGPDQNLILLDGVPVYNANHLFGFFSVFNSDAIKDVKLLKGGYPARYGGRLSSVLDINMKEGNLNKFGGSASIGLISSKVFLEGPLVKDKTSFIISGRRTYLDILAQPIIKKALENENQEGRTGYYFYDMNFKINHKFSEKDRLYYSLYGGRDKFYADIKDKKTTNRDFADNDLGWGNITNALRWNHQINKKTFLNTTLTNSNYSLNTDFKFGTDNIGVSKDKEFFGLYYLSGINDYAAKVDLDYVPNPDHFIRVGANSIYHIFRPGKFTLENVNTKSNYSRKDTVGQKNIPAVETAIYIEDDYNISNKLKVNYGLHFSLFSVDDKLYNSLQPRVGMRYLLPGNSSLKASFTTMRQYINLLAFEGIGLPTDIWVPATKKIKPQDSWQAAAGWAKSIGDDLELSVEGYYKKMTNLVAYADGQGIFQTDDWQNRVVQGDGESYGGEVLLQKKNGRLSGWVGYTLSWANRKFPDIDNGKAFPYRYDRRHDVSIVASYEISKKINIAGTWVYGTGNAVTLPDSKYDGVIPSRNGSSYGDGSVYNAQVFGQRNNFRMRPYHRLDVGINFVKDKGNRKRTWSIGAYNAYANNNPFFINFANEYDPKTQTSNRVLKQTTLFPLVPYVTWTVDF